MTAIRLVTRADDLGSFAGATPAALAALRHGVVKNVSVMVGAPSFAATAELLRAVPRVCIGVHLTMNCEWRQHRWGPVAPPARVPCLVDAQGYLLPDPLQVHQRGVVMEQVLHECQAQLARARAAGLDVCYLDTHCGWEWIHEPSGPPRASELLAEWCRREGVRWYMDPPLRGFGIAPPGGADGVTARARTFAALARLTPGNYLWQLHPCWPSHAILTEGVGGGVGVIARERVEDTALFCDPDLPGVLERHGITAVRFDELPEPQAAASSC